MNTVFFTGNGDGGESIVGKKKVEKDHPVLGFLGSLDELNSTLGWCGVASEAGSSDEEISCRDTLRRMQEMLFIMQAEIASALFDYPSSKKISSEHVAYLEEVIREIDAHVPPITQFIISGGCELSARIDIARAVSRRVERDAVMMRKQCAVSAETMRFLNRISSVLFALARYANHTRGISETHPSYK